MDSISYVGENLLPGRIGHAFVILAFLTGLLSLVSGIIAEQKNSDSWRTLMRGSFFTHFISVVVIMGTLFFMMVSEFYEYKYVQAHVSEELPMRYVLSAFWEGQEGSFLLWMFWNSVLGCIVFLRDIKWQTVVVPVIAFCQVLLCTMILGIYVGFGENMAKIGSSPFVLLRNTMDAPVFSNPNYLELIDGQGLNVLLQNYWNTIHPPTLFLGFASVIIPFAYAIGSLVRGDYLSWLKPAKKWALFSSFMLGLGVCMGSAWAYEALTFGGYWAWDPVENMSLVPWLFLIAGLHSNIIVQSTRQSLKSTYVFYILAFIGIVYSTFLTRSGVLEDTSVHAFTQLGLETQLVSMIVLFTLLSFGLFLYRRNDIPVPAKEEPVNSKEFWMYIGALVITISACLITYGTSLPIINDIVQFIDPQFKDMVIEDQVAHYNKHQLWIGVLLGLLTGMAQFFRYRGANWSARKRQILSQIGLTAILSGLLAFGSTYIINATAWQYQLLLFSGWYAIIGNVLAFVMNSSKNYSLLGSTSSHVGFGILIIGILLTGLNQRTISSNMFAQRGLAQMDDEVLKKNIILLKGEPMFMNNYRVTYESDSMNNQYRYFFLDVEEMTQDRKEVKDSFELVPNVIYTSDYSDVEALNPAIKRGIYEDIFTRITRLPLNMMNLQKAATMDDSLDYIKYAASVGDTVFTKQYAITVNDVREGSQHSEYESVKGDYPLSVDFDIYDLKEDTSYRVSPALLLRGPMAYSLPIEKKNLNLRIKLRDTIFENILTSENQLNYEEFALNKGESIEWKGNMVRFNGINSDVKHPGYTPQKGDLAVSAHLSIEDEKGITDTLEPIYVIREQKVNGIRDVDLDRGIYARIKSIKPDEKKFYIELAQGQSIQDSRVYFEVAEDVPESEFIVFQATVMPGINLIWLGMILMLSGLMISLVRRKTFKSDKVD